MTTTTETFTRQYPIALAAIAAHIQDRGLPAPIDIYIVDELRDGRTTKTIRMHLSGEHTHQPWLDSVHVDGVQTEPGLGGRGLRHQWFVRLPDTGIRLQLVGFRFEALTAVPA